MKREAPGESKLNEWATGCPWTMKLAFLDDSGSVAKIATENGWYAQCDFDEIKIERCELMSRMWRTMERRNEQRKPESRAS
jgi:hypothetical protein